MSQYDENRITYLAVTDARNKKTPFGIKAKDRVRHVYVIGKTGMGKSTLLENMAVQDIQNGEGFAFIDPHGSTAEKLLEYIGEERIKDVLYFAPFDMDYPVSFNVMEDVGADKRHLVANGLMSAFKKIWVDAWSARMEYILNNILLALLEYPDSTLIGVNRMLADKDYRNKVVENVTDPAVKAFWTEEYAKYTDRFAAEAAPAIQNKIGQFISNPLIRNIIGQPNSSFDIRKIMDEKKIMIINLSKGKVGEANANLLGSMLITKIYLSAMSRADIKHDEMSSLPNFYLYVDEFQSFANESFANILSEARKYKLNLTIAHQYIEQMSEEVRAAVFGNVGTMISFRVGAYDAEVLEKEFAPEFTAEDMVNLGFAQVYMKLMIDGVSSSPFSAVTLPPITKPRFTYVDQLVASSRETFANKRSQVEDFIKKWHESEGSSKDKLSVHKDKPQQSGQTDRSSYKTKNSKKPKDFKTKVEQPFKEAFKTVFGSSKNNEGDNERRDDGKAERESGLRKAISLAYLKEGKNVPKKEIADESEENNERVKEKDSSISPKGGARGHEANLEIKNKNINYAKEPTAENLAILREAVSSVEGEYIKDKKEIPDSVGPKEIPEEKLKEMLNVQKPEDGK